MKKNIALLAAIMLGAISASAQDNAQASAPAASGTTVSPAFSANVSLGYDGKYVFRGTQLAEAFFSPAVNLSYGNLYGGLWFAVPVENSDDYVNEMDANVGYTIPAGELVKVDLGLTRYAYDHIVDSWFNQDNSLEAYVGVNFNTILSPAVYFYRDFDCETYTIEGKIGHSIEVSKAFSVALGASIGEVYTDLSNVDDYFYANAKADVIYAITEKSSASLGVRYGGSSEKSIGRHADTHNAVWFGASVSTNF
jgi:hypothetical protein